MKLYKTLQSLVCCGAFLIHASVRAEETTGLLEQFKSYEQGKPVAQLIATRQALFSGTGDEKIRSQRERELLAFIASDAHPQAKAIAIQWLGSLGSAASVPALIAARETPALAAPVAAALECIPGPEAERARIATPKNPLPVAAPVAEVAEFSKTMDSKPNDDIIIKALSSPNDHLAGSALRRIRAGAGSPENLIAAIHQLPPARQAMLCDALSTRADAANALHPVLITRVKSGDPGSRVAALPALGRILRPDDLISLLDLAANGSPEIKSAARTAFTRATDPGINPALIRIAAATDKAQALIAIETLADRAAVEAVTPLWALAEKGDAQTAALKALGSLIMPDDLPSLLKKLAAADDTPLAEALGKTTWEVVRRHPDPASAADLLEKASANAPSAVKELLERYATRIRPKPTATAGPTLDLPQQDDRPSLAPNGFKEVVYLNCGPSAEARDGDFIIRRIAGQGYQFGNVAHPLATVDFGKEIAYEISGLDPGGDYVLGVSAWDADLGKRRQSLLVDGKEILTDFAPLAWHADKPTYTRIHLPLPRDATADGKATITVKATAGPNAVLSELWLLRRKAAPAKRIVIITGDDYPAHHWRVTGPDFAKILRADPRLEVTISESPALLGSPALSSYDAVFLHFKNYADRLSTSAALWKNVEQYVNQGGGLVVAHFGCGAMQEWDGYVKLAGRIWDPKKRAHDPYGPFPVRITGKSHPVCNGLTDFSTRDELYTCLAGDAEIEVLAEAVSKVDQSSHPMAFVLKPGKGRVFHCPLGHDLGALEAQGVRNLYLRGTLWAAGL